MRRNLLESAIPQSLSSLAKLTRHANSAQFHLVTGLHSLRVGDWSNAIPSLRKADELYVPSVNEGSTLARIQSIAMPPAPAVAPVPAAGTTSDKPVPASKDKAAASPTPVAASSKSPPVTKASPSSTVPATASLELEDELELTQPMEFEFTQPTQEMDEDTSEQPQETAPIATTTTTPDAPTTNRHTPTPPLDSLPPTTAPPAAAPIARSEFVARKAADIKTCLAIAIWKAAYEKEVVAREQALLDKNSTAASSSSSRSQSPSADSSSAYSESKRLFVDALELESGRRAATWGHFATFLAATHSIEVAKSLLIHVMSQYENEHPAGDDDSTDSSSSPSHGRSSWSLASLRNNLAVMQLKSIDEEEKNEGIMNLQDILVEMSEGQGGGNNGIYHLQAVANYAIIVMKQQE